MSSSLLALRDAIVSTIDTNITSIRTCRAHGGSFDLQELKRWAVKSPAALVACLGLNSISREGGQIVGEATFGIFIVTQGVSTQKRDENSIALVEEIAGLLGNNSWNYINAQAPMDMRASNLYNSPLDSQGYAIWMMGWKQSVDLNIFDASGLDDFNTLQTEYDLGPYKDGIIEAEDLILLNGEFMSAYAHSYISTPAATSIAVVDTYQKLAGTTTIKEYLNCDMPADIRLRHTGTVAKPFLVTASVSITVSSDAKVTLAIAKNGVVDANTEIEQEITLAGGAEAFSLKDILELDENKYAEVWVKADDTVNVTATKMNFVIGAI